MNHIQVKGFAAFANSLSISSYSVSYMVEAVVSRKGSSIRGAALDPRYLALARGKGSEAKRFRTVCGDGFIGEFTMGGEYNAVIQILTRSKSETEAVAASVSASFNMASGSAAFASSLKQIATSNEVRIWTMQRGGNGIMPTTVDEMAAKASNLAAEVKAESTPMQAAIFSYLTLADYSPGQSVDFAKREVALSYLSDLSRAVRDQQANAQYILDHPSEFYSSPTDLPQLAKELTALKEYRKVIFAKASECVESGGNCTKIDIDPPKPTARPARK